MGLGNAYSLELSLEKLEYLKFPFILTLGMSLKGLGHQVLIFRYTQPTMKLRQWNIHLFVSLLWLIGFIVWSLYGKVWSVYIKRSVKSESDRKQVWEFQTLLFSHWLRIYFTTLDIRGLAVVWWHELPARDDPFLRLKGGTQLHWWQTVA